MGSGNAVYCHRRTKRRIAGGLVSVSDYTGRVGSLENTPASADVCHDGDDVSGR